ncbi:hypothetical protein [Brevibacillus laterosporus]|uniref:hypothetical protein n=1 Tax=Brevibacillus laterosporus TaxID=1465 RepID=UPI003D1D62E4
MLEIESQTSSVLAGGVAGFLLGLIGLQYVLFFNALTYLFAFLMVCRISYSFTFFTLVGLFMRLILIGLFTVITDTTGAVLRHIILIGLLLLGVLGIMRSLRPLLQESVERST